MVTWVETVAVSSQPIRASRLDGNGNAVWSPGTVSLKTSSTGTSRLAAASSSAGFGIFAWSDGDFGDADVLVQNLNSDGSLGSPGIFADGFESGNLSAWSSSVP